MCGIAGIVAPLAGRLDQALKRMTSALAHRGPDGQGSLAYANCLLGHARLSIIDLSTGAQPMRSAVSPAAVTFNGEIYGYKELRAALAPRPFDTTSDTEVILALYERHGEDMPSHLPGMFAFAIWDEQRQTLFCARDRFGEKPFYYSHGPDGEFLFASEIKSILASGLIRPVLDPAVLASYLAQGAVPAHRSIYANVHVLPPGHCLAVGLERRSVRRYWELPATTESLSLDEADEEFTLLFRQALARQLVADVPVGVFLSGGLDSASIVATASSIQRSISTFSFGFEAGVSELPFARAVATMYGTDHHELQDADLDIGQILPRMAEVYDEPFADSSCVPTWLLCSLVRRHTKVVLGGDGGDELLGGYTARYGPLLAMSKPLPGGMAGLWLLRLARKLARAAGIGFPQAWTDRISGQMLRRAFRDELTATLGLRRTFTRDEIIMLGIRAEEAPPLAGFARMGGLEDALRYDVCEYLPGDILYKVDRAAMAHGLEVRCPFLDRDLAEFCISLPWRLKTDGVHGKLLLRRAMAEAWPEQIRTREKQGFGAPVRQWLRTPAGRALKARYLEDSSAPVYGLLDRQACLRHASRDDQRTWTLLVLSIWLRHAPPWAEGRTA